jgi:ribose transport system substrate-binding protein
MRDLSGRWARLALAAGILALAIGLSACGGGSSSSGGATSEAGSGSEGAGEAEGGSSQEVAAAQKLVAEASAPQKTWKGPTSSPPPAAGKTIGIVPCGLAVPGCALLAEGAEEAAKALGWNSITVDGRSDPQATVQAIHSLIARHVDAIDLAVIQPESVSEQIEEATDAGIEVVTTFTPDVTEFGGTATVRQEDERAGEYQAAYVIANGCGGIVSFTSEELVQVGERATGFNKYMEENGGSKCDVIEHKSIPLSQVGPPEEPIVSSVLQANAGKVEWFVGSFDALLRPMLTAAEGQGDTEIKGVGSDGDIESLELIRKEQGQVATTGSPLKWAGWAVMDQLNRAFSGAPLAKSEGVEPKLLDKENLPPEGHSYEGDLDYQAKYEQLWSQG